MKKIKSICQLSMPDPYFFVVIILLAGCGGKQEIEKLSPLPNYRLLEVISKDNIARRDLAYIFTIVFRGKGDEIKFVVKNGLMQRFPDRRFYQQDTVKRFQFAILLTRILFNHPNMPLPDSIPKITDVGYTYFAKRPIQLGVSLNLMKLNRGKFFPDMPITGADALFSIKQLKKIVK